MENYNIYDEIGRGAHSFVYKARRKRSIEYVAVKSTSKSRMSKILNEVQILHKLHSRFVLKFYNWYESKNHIWLIFEYCIGGDLLNLITQDKSLPEATVQRFGYELMAGLQYLHSNGILFCDLKPANILIDEYGSLKLADFGLARRIPNKQSINSKLLPPGSPNYMAPELFNQPIVHSFASDFWALGCVLYELSTGTQPFIHSNFSELAHMIQTKEIHLPVPGHTMSKEFCDVLTHLLQKDPRKRITWKALLLHPFWTGLEPLKQLSMPRQESFEETFAPLSLTAAQRLSGDVENPESEGNNAVPSPNGIDRRDDSNQKQQYQTQTTQEGAGTEAEPQETLDDDCVSQESGSLTSRTDSAAKREPADHETRENGDENSVNKNNSKRLLASESDVKQLYASEIHPNDKTHVVRAPKTAPSAANPQTAIRRIRSSQSRQQDTIDMNRRPDLFFAELDICSKPVMVNDEIERVPAPLPKKSTLPFDLLSAEELLTTKFDQLKGQLNKIFQHLRATDPRTDHKLEGLSYLLQLVMDQRLAIIVANSSIMVLLMKLLRDSYDTDDVIQLEFATRVCLVLGIVAFCLKKGTPVGTSNHMRTLVEILVLVIRSTTQQLKSDLSQSASDLNQLTPCEVQRSMLKRRAVACCGELVCFLSSTKPPSLDQSFLRPALQCLLSTLIDGDAVTRHYALRTFCNMMITGVDATLTDQFSHEVVPRLLVAGIVTDQSMPQSVKRAHHEALAMYLFRFAVQQKDRLKASDQILRLLEETNLAQSMWNVAWDADEDSRTRSLCLSVLTWFVSTSEDSSHKRSSFLMQFDSGRILEFVSGSEESCEDGALVVLRAKFLLLLCCGCRAAKDLVKAVARSDPWTVIQTLLKREAVRTGSDYEKGNAIDLYLRAMTANSETGTQPSSREYLIQCCLYLNCILACAQ